MRKTRRKIIRDKRRIKIKVFAAAVFLLIAGVLGAFFYTADKNASPYISPIPDDYDISSSGGTEKSIDNLESKLIERDIKFREIKKGGNYFVIIIDDDASVILSRDKDIDIQIASLQFILTRLTMESRTFKSLDLRYNKPIIRE